MPLAVKKSCTKTHSDELCSDAIEERRAIYLAGFAEAYTVHE
jgi:hypothetical protein